MSANFVNTFLSRELIASAVNGLKARSLKQAKSPFKDLPVWQREIKADFFAAQHFGHDYRHPVGNSPSIVNFVDKTALFQLSHDAIIDNVVNPQ